MLIEHRALENYWHVVAESAARCVGSPWRAAAGARPRAVARAGPPGWWPPPTAARTARPR